jgi:hypothetical protein
MSIGQPINYINSGFTLSIIEGKTDRSSSIICFIDYNICAETHVNVVLPWYQFRPWRAMAIARNEIPAKFHHFIVL